MSAPALLARMEPSALTDLMDMNAAALKVLKEDYVRATLIIATLTHATMVLV